MALSIPCGFLVILGFESMDDGSYLTRLLNLFFEFALNFSDSRSKACKGIETPAVSSTAWSSLTTAEGYFEAAM